MYSRVAARCGDPGTPEPSLFYEWVLSHLHPISGGFVGVLNVSLWKNSSIEEEGLLQFDNESSDVGLCRKLVCHVFVSLSVVAHAGHEKQRVCRSSVARPQQTALHQGNRVEASFLTTAAAMLSGCCQKTMELCFRLATCVWHCGLWSSLLYSR